jgi:acetaldehyde dehydrogenase (acetylating)
MDSDLRSIQQARTLLGASTKAYEIYHLFDQAAVDTIVSAMITAGIGQAERLAKLAHSETGFGRIESKIEKNLFATKTLGERMAGMKTCGIIRKTHNESVWEIASPMGVIAALIPSTNPTSTAMYKAIIAAKARCGIVMSPHPRAAESTAEALKVVADAAYKAGAPTGLFGCMTEISLDGTNALLEDERTDLILATGGSAMVKSAYSKGKPAYGVGSGNVPVYVDRSADLEKAAKDIVYGAFFDHGTLCSTERSIVADTPIKKKLIEQLKKSGAIILDDDQKTKLRNYIIVNGHLNIDQVGRSPAYIAEKAGFSVPPKTRALVAEVKSVGKSEPLSMETLSPILTLFDTDGWEAGCSMCKEILSFGGIGHTLGIHAGNDRVIEAFGLEKPAMRIIVNSVCALGSVGYTTQLFPAMTLGPGTIGGSITSDNISPMDLINIKRVAFETNPIHPSGAGAAPSSRTRAKADSIHTHAEQNSGSAGWIDEIESRLRDRDGSPPRTIGGSRTRVRPTLETPPVQKPVIMPPSVPAAEPAAKRAAESSGDVDASSPLALTTDKIDELIKRFKKT